MINKSIEILKDNKVIGIVGSRHTGKSTVLLNLLDKTLQNKKVLSYVFSYHQEQRDSFDDLPTMKQRQLRFFNTIEELEQIQDSFIFIDEFHFLFDLTNRNKLSLIKSCFNQLNHNNNVVVLCSTPENYNKYVSSVCKCFMLTRLKFEELVNGSNLKRYINDLSTDLKASTGFYTPKYKAFYKGSVLNVEYNKKQDKKADNINLFEGFKENKGKKEVKK